MTSSVSGAMHHGIDRGLEFFMMAESVVFYTDKDVSGAKLREKCVEKNNEHELRRWIECRGLTTTKTETHAALVRRVKEIMTSGLDKFVFNPDKDTALGILQDHVRNLPALELPQLDNWTESMDVIPRKYSYTTIVEYLLKRTFRIVHASGEKQDTVVPLPTAEKPLVKGFNFFASGHVGEILLNATGSIVHMRTSVLASMRECRYDVKCAVDSSTGLVIQAECKCPAGAGGKCNHVAGLLFARLDYVITMRNPDCCTNQTQVWHVPRRTKKADTHSAVVGERKVVKHLFGKERKRKGPLQDYSTYQAIPEIKMPCRTALLHDVQELKFRKHDVGLFQILVDSSDDSESDYSDDENLSPEELVVKKLQVSDLQAREIEKETLGQSDNPTWFNRRSGRITASNAKAYCGKGNPVPLVQAVLREKPSAHFGTVYMRYGLDHEEEAVEKYTKQMPGIHVRKCGLFVDTDHGQLAASPDRIAVLNGVTLCVEVKCLSSSRHVSPMEAIRSKQKESGFAFKLDNSGPCVKKSHKYFTQIQMQMAVTGTKVCHVVVFTNSTCDVEVITVSFDQIYWRTIREKLLEFHATYVVPALVERVMNSKKPL